MKHGAVVYLATNKRNGKRYIGVTRYTVAKRWGEHKAGAKSGRKSALYSAIRKYGEDAFDVTEFASCLLVGDGPAVEREAIKQERPEYNLTNGGEFTAGRRRLSPEAAERIRRAHSGKTISPEQRAQIAKKLSDRHANDPEYRAVQLAALEKGRAKIDHRKRIEAVRRAAAEGRMGSPMTPERLARQLAAMTTPEARRKMADSKSRPVECTTLATVFDSVSEAAALTGLSVSGVSSVCRGVRRQANGLHFVFI